MAVVGARRADRRNGVLQAAQVGYVLSGRMKVVLDDGDEVE